MQTMCAVCISDIKERYFNQIYFQNYSVSLCPALSSMTSFDSLFFPTFSDFPIQLMYVTFVSSKETIS